MKLSVLLPLLPVFLGEKAGYKSNEVFIIYSCKQTSPYMHMPSKYEQINNIE